MSKFTAKIYPKTKGNFFLLETNFEVRVEVGKRLHLDFERVQWSSL
jgi:hypothetical protein